MGRLFWKFFLAFWLALLIAGSSVGSLVWFIHNEDSTSSGFTQPHIDEHAGVFIDVLELAIQYGGITSLSEVVIKLNHAPLPTLFILDQSDEDILGREVDEQLVSEAKQWHLSNKTQEAVRTLISHDEHYLVFAVRSFSPFSARPPSPFSPPDSANEAHPPPPDGVKGRPHRPPSKWLLFITGTLASLFFSAALAWYFFKPINNLRNGFKAVSNGNLDVKVSPVMANRTDELADLGKSFDAMTGKIDRVLKSQQQLLHDVSHEVRSPLARIQAAIGLAQQQPDKITIMLDRIETESQRISDLVGELLILSKLDSGSMHLEKDDFDFSDLVNVIVNNAKFEAQPKNINIIYEGPSSLNYYGNTELLHRAIENIVRNAVKFTPNNKAVIITLTNNSEANRLELTVEDNGPGVAEHDLSAIFTPFFRSDMPFRHDGIGLGLTIANRAVIAHGGSIKAKNRLDTGLEFDIILPLDNEKAPT